jgi:hypothetical protein
MRIVSPENLFTAKKKCHGIENRNKLPKNERTVVSLRTLTTGFQRLSANFEKPSEF